MFELVLVLVALLLWGAYCYLDWWRLFYHGQSLGVGSLQEPEASPEPPDSEPDSARAHHAYLGASLLGLVAAVVAVGLLSVGGLRLLVAYLGSGAAWVALGLELLVLVLLYLGLSYWFSTRGAGSQVRGTVEKYTGAFAKVGRLLSFIPKLAQADPIVEESERAQMISELTQVAEEVTKDNEELHLDSEDREILHQVMEFTHLRLSEVMVPRTEMVTLEPAATVAEALEVFLETGFSRIPLLGETIDEVSGIVYLKDLLGYWVEGETEIKVQSFCRPAEFVPETGFVDQQLRKMQEDNLHMSLVIDEYGGVCGLITIEDILEEIVGQIYDEHDFQRGEAEKLGKNLWRVPTSCSLDDLSELIGVSISEESVHSLGGLMTKCLDHLPQAGNVADFGPVHLVAEKTIKHQSHTILVSLREDS